jgi:phospholipid/cholesterol/gamma-HCH transport system ATP-binding protein
VAQPRIIIRVENLTAAYEGDTILEGVTFEVRAGEVFGILGGSGSGKSTLLKHMIGLYQPVAGKIFIEGKDVTSAEGPERSLLRRFGVTYQSGALFGSMTLLENIALPLQEFTDLPPDAIQLIAKMKLQRVGLAGFESHMPAELSGGMQKRAGLARAMALDPEILFFDEPSAGLDPISSRLLDDLILELRASLGATVVVVTHELSSIFTIGNNSVFLDTKPGP